MSPAKNKAVRLPAAKDVAALVEATEAIEAATESVSGQAESAAKGSRAGFVGYEDALQVNNANFEAFLKAGAVLARGWQEFGNGWINLAQQSIQDSISAGKAIAGARSLKELIELQSTLAKTNFDRLVRENARLSELTAKVTEEALNPLTNRVKSNVEKVAKTAA